MGPRKGRTGRGRFETCRTATSATQESRQGQVEKSYLYLHAVQFIFLLAKLKVS